MSGPIPFDAIAARIGDPGKIYLVVKIEPSPARMTGSFRFYGHGNTSRFKFNHMEGLFHPGLRKQDGCFGFICQVPDLVDTDVDRLPGMEPGDYSYKESYHDVFTPSN